MARLLHYGGALPIEEALKRLGSHGWHGARDDAEGVVYRVEREDAHGGVTVDFLAKYVRPQKQDGIYLPEVSGQTPVWNRWVFSDLYNEQSFLGHHLARLEKQILAEREA